MDFVLFTDVSWTPKQSINIVNLLKESVRDTQYFCLSVLAYLISAEMTHMSYPPQNGVTYAKPHITKIRLRVSAFPEMESYICHSAIGWWALVR